MSKWDRLTMGPSLLRWGLTPAVWAAAVGSLILIPTVARGDGVLPAEAAPSGSLDARLEAWSVADQPVPFLGSAPAEASGDGVALEPLAVQPIPDPGGTGSFTKEGASAPYGVTSVTSLAGSGIPVRAYEAYVRAQSLLAADRPACHLDWALVAGIGRVESNHGRFGGAGFTADGRVVPAILGPLLDGHLPGTAVIRDTDNGVYDGNSRWDRAVGPMQFLPQTWKRYGGDANGDGQRDPQQMDDAAHAAGMYLCAGGGDLSTYQGRYAAVYRYNHSDSYVRLVLSLAATYSTGEATTVPDIVPVDGHEGATEAGADPGGPPLGIADVGGDAGAVGATALGATTTTVSDQSTSSTSGSVPDLPPGPGATTTAPSISTVTSPSVTTTSRPTTTAASSTTTTTSRPATTVPTTTTTSRPTTTTSSATTTTSRPATTAPSTTTTGPTTTTTVPTTTPTEPTTTTVAPTSTSVTEPGSTQTGTTAGPVPDAPL